MPANPSDEAASPGVLTPRLVGFLAFLAGATVANLYYSQPLLTEIAASFHLRPGAAGLVVVATQIGYALGLLLLVPLGDGHERRGLITRATAAIAVMLAAVALAPSFPLLLLASLLMGAVTIVPQLVVPYTATFAPAARRGRFIGIVMSGLLVGVVLSRSVSGFAAPIGWRALFAAAAGISALLALAAAAILPPQHPHAARPYRALLRSLADLWRSDPILRMHSALGAFGFAAFSCFWTALIFHFHHLFPRDPARMVGIMGFFGAAGAIAAPVSGRISDRRGAGLVNGSFLALIVVAFLILWQAHTDLALVALGVMALDAGVQGSHISNQTRIYARPGDLRNRLTALYMTAYFLGGAAGSFLGAMAWQEARWPGVCAVGGLCGLCGLARLALGPRPAGTRGLAP